MLTRVRIDNYLCFVNFEYRPARKQLILGGNSSGKTSLLKAILAIRQFATSGLKAADLFLLHRRTRWLNQPSQSFEVEALLDDGIFNYKIEIGLAGHPPVPLVSKEIVLCDGKPIFEFVDGEVRLFDDQFANIVTYPFDRERSAFETVPQGQANHRLAKFKGWISGLYCFALDPVGMQARTDKEDSFPQVSMGNIASWYRDLIQSAPRQTAALTASLQEAIAGFNFLTLAASGENTRILMADFKRPDGSIVRFNLSELSDGQRCLIGLYAILHVLLASGCTVIVDEPDNFVALREIQPWLMAVSDMVDGGHGQILVISHHPEYINQWAPSCGIRFERDQVGAVRAEPFTSGLEDSLSPAEVVARGWDRD